MLIGYEVFTTSAPEAEESLHRHEFPNDGFWFAHRWTEIYCGWTRGPRPADVVAAVDDSIHRREYPVHLTRVQDLIYLGWQRSPATEVKDESIHRREFPADLRHALDLTYFGFQRGPLPADAVVADDSITIHKREHPVDRWWFTRPEALTWQRGPLAGNVEPQSGQTITVEPLAGCGSNLWRAYKRYIDDQFTWTRWQTDVPLVAETPPIRGEWPTDLRLWALPQYRRDLFDFTQSPQVSHWCEVGAVFLFTAANWSVGVQFYFEAYFRAFIGTGRARLFNKTDNTVVFGSEVSTVSPILVRLRSGALTLVDGREYITQIAAETNVNGTAIESSRLVAI